MRTVSTRVWEPVQESNAKLEVAVIGTSVKQTLPALRTAGKLARGLNGTIRLIVPQIVPFPAPLDQPLVQRSFMARKFRTIAEEAAIDTRVDIWLCREWEAPLVEWLQPHSVVVIGALRRWWWPSKERRLARTLRKHGHHVVLVEEDDA